MTDPAVVAGRTVVTARAHRRVLQALAAEELGVSLRAAKVALRDDRGALAAQVTSAASPGRGSPLLSRIEATKSRLLTDGARLTGARITDVSVRITGLHTDPGRVE